MNDDTADIENEGVIRHCLLGNYYQFKVIYEDLFEKSNVTARDRSVLSTTPNRILQ